MTDASKNIETTQKTRIFHTFFFPVTFVILLWLVKISEIVFHYPLYNFGVYPRQLKGVIGILTAPLIHADFGHLFSNTVPLLVLGSGLFYYYRSFAYRVFFIILLATGFWVWVSARPSYHIGASGVVYGLAAFMFASGLVKKNMSLAAFSLVVVFLYGNLVWGVLPVLPQMSWESHLFGAVAGVLVAFYYRKQGPSDTTYQWQLEDDNEVTEETLIYEEVLMKNNPTQNQSEVENESENKKETLIINYTVKPNNRN